MPLPCAALFVLLFSFSTRAYGESKTKKTDEDSSRWSLQAKANLSAGYDNSAALSGLARPGEAQPTATTTVSGSLGPTLQITETLESSLSYSFEHGVHWANHDLDMQTHSAELELEYESANERLKLGLSYGFGASILLPKNVFYSLDHTLGPSVTVLLYSHHDRWWIKLTGEYTFSFADVRDETSQHLRGPRHRARLYPEIVFGKRLTLQAGYELERPMIGEVQDQVAGINGGTATVTSPLSFVGHYGFANADWQALKKLEVELTVYAGRKFFPDLTVVGQLGRGLRTTRTDTVVSGLLEVTYELWKLKLIGKLNIEKSMSTISTRVISGSYTHVVASGGVGYSYK